MVTDPKTGARRNSVVKIWDVFTGRDLYILPGDNDQAAFVAVSPNGDRLARSVAAIDPKTFQVRFDVELWDMFAARKICTLRGRNFDTAYRMVFSPDGKRLAGHTEENLVRGVVKLWDVSTGELLFTLQGHDRFIYRLAFSPDGSRLASAGDDGTVRLWDLSTGKMIHILQHEHPVHSVAFGPDGKRLASGLLKGQIQIWDTDEGLMLLTLLTEGDTDNVSSLAFLSSPHGERLVSVSQEKKSVKIWDGTRLHRRADHHRCARDSHRPRGPCLDRPERARLSQGAPDEQDQDRRDRPPPEHRQSRPRLRVLSEGSGGAAADRPRLRLPGPFQGVPQRLGPVPQRLLDLLLLRLGPRVRVFDGYAEAATAARTVAERLLADEGIDVGVLQQRGETVPARLRAGCLACPPRATTML